MRRVAPPAKSMLNGTLLWGNADGLKAAKEWDSSYIRFSSDPAWYAPGRMFAVIFTGNGTPQLVLDSLVKEQWWMPIMPDRVDRMGDKRVAWFSMDRVLAECAAYGVDSAGQLHNFAVIATGGLITTYEVSYIGK